jgi:hypothetical protein
MNLKRTASITCVGGALAAWLAGAATSNHAVLAPIVDVPQPIDARGAELAKEIARLHERLRPTSTPRQPGRNLFAFRAGLSRALPPTAPVAPPAIVEAPPTAPAEPALKLSGIAEDADGDGAPVRTAIIAGDGQLFMVKEGENVTSRYRVARISTDVVELTDLTSGISRRLAMK